MPELDGLRLDPASGGPARALVVLCHGYSGDGHLMGEAAAGWSKALPDTAIVCPHGPQPYEEAPEGRQWFSLLDRTPGALEAGLREAAPILARFIAAELRRLDLPGDAYALAGFSQGAMMALFAGLRQTPPPRGIIAYAGALHAQQSLQGDLRARPPVLLVHGDVDDMVPVQRSQEAEQVLRRAGIAVESLYVPGLGHELTPEVLAAGARFLKRVLDAA